jgi:hypothetical protein
MNSGTPVNKILILAASPKDMNRVRLEEELRDIEEVLQRAKKRDQFEVKLKLAVRYRDIRQAMLDFDPQIVHFSGHGEGEGGLVFEDGTGKAKLVDAEALAELFDLFKHVKCVVLNACYSENQAEAIAQHIDYVIGMSQAIGDTAAIEFAVGFYDALGAGRSFEDAYKFGKNAIHIASIPEHLTPKLVRKNQLGTEADYTRLRNLLAAGKWKEADEETLAVMLKISGREKEGFLDTVHIEKFPSHDLQTIDQLWVHYSKGRFGFSVQKNIWESVGGKPGSGVETFRKFGDRLGWRVNGSWLNYRNLAFNANAPLGHLPWSGIGDMGWGGKRWRLGYLLVRPELEAENTSSGDDLRSERNVDYRRLRDLLRAGNWKQADQETLAVMLKAAGREQENWLSSESIENFPCTDLRTIDQLWVKYSGGRFGFSVQKRIWESVGKDEKKFGDRVGWRRNNKWLYYNVHLTFNTNAPEGHLPSRFWFDADGDNYDLIAQMYFLDVKKGLGFFRLVKKCNI